MMYDCSCDYDSGDYEPILFYNEANPKARKVHKCDECDGVINAGERYTYITGKCDGVFIRHKICRICDQIIKDHFPCGMALGLLWEELHEKYGDIALLENQS